MASTGGACDLVFMAFPPGSTIRHVPDSGLHLEWRPAFPRGRSSPGAPCSSAPRRARRRVTPRTFRLGGIGVCLASLGKRRLVATGGAVCRVRTMTVTFEKGSSRFGRDQTAITSRATGFDLSPRLNIILRTSRWSVYLGAKYVRIQFSHQAAIWNDTPRVAPPLALAGLSKVGFRLV